MPEDLSDIRARIHSKSHQYFTFSFHQRDKSSWQMFYGATDALLDAGMAASAFSQAVGSNSAVNLLVCYGFLQALYIQQDAVWVLSRAVGLKWHPNSDSRIKEIRDIRNRLTGHPALAGEKPKPPRRLSSAIISRNDVRSDGFKGSIYFEDGFEQINVNVATVLQDNEERLALQMRNIEVEMDNQERDFRTEQARRPLSDNFDTGFGYLVEKLPCDLNDESRVVQARTHVQMIREIMRRLQKELDDRGFGSAMTDHHIDLILTALEIMAQTMRKKKHSRADQNKIYLAFDGLQKNLDDLRSITEEIDTRLKTAIITSSPPSAAPR